MTEPTIEQRVDAALRFYGLTPQPACHRHPLGCPVGGERVCFLGCRCYDPPCWLAYVKALPGYLIRRARYGA